MPKDYERLSYLKSYEAGVIKDRLIHLESELEALGFKREARTIRRIGQDIEIWQHK